MSDTQIKIRPGIPTDIPEVLSLIYELAVYEKSEQFVLVNEEELLKHGFGEQPDYGLYVAEVDGAVRGIAIYYYCFSTWRGKYLYLEDLIVSEAHRKLGLGSQLFEALIQKAKSEGLRQMGWQVLDWNEPAIKFYKKHGAELQSEWLNGRFYFE